MGDDERADGDLERMLAFISFGVVGGGGVVAAASSLQSQEGLCSSPLASGNVRGAQRVVRRKGLGRSGRGRSQCVARGSGRGIEKASAPDARPGSSEDETSALNSSIESTGARAAMVIVTTGRSPRITGRGWLGGSGKG